MAVTTYFGGDYRALNSVTKVYTFPLPHIDPTSGFWKIQMEPVSRKKIDCICHTSQAPFQRLMQRVLHGLNPEDGNQFVAAYLNDILIFSETLQDDLTHMQSVIDRMKSVNLKVKPVKGMFVRREVGVSWT